MVVSDGAALIAGMDPDLTPGIWVFVTDPGPGVDCLATVATALARAGIACNMVAGHHHDHAFVPEDDAARALAILRDLARDGA